MKQIIALILILVSWQTFAQDAIVNFDQARSDSVFADVGGGVKESVFPVTGNLESLVFLVAFQAGNPVVELVTPKGEVLGMDSPLLKVQRSDWGVMVGIQSPALGQWALRLSQSLGDGSYNVKVFSVPAIPTLKVTAPLFSQEPWTSSTTVEGTTQPDQAGKRVKILVSQKGANQGGLEAGEAVVGANGAFSYRLDPAEFPAGEYSISAALQDGDNPSVQVEASGTLQRPVPPPLGAVSGAVFIVEQPDALVVNFTNPFGRRPVTFRVHISGASGTQESIDIGNQTKVRLTGFVPGAAQVWVTGVDALGQEGDAGTKTSVVFDSPPVVVAPLVLTSRAVDLSLLLGQEPSTASFALTGTFSPRGPSADYVEAIVGALPGGFTVRPLKGSWYLPQESSSLKFSVSVATDVVPGVYPIAVTFRTVGSPSNAVDGTLTLTVIRPVPAVSSISPATWLDWQNPVLTVTGSNFLPGTQVFVDGVEQSILSLTEGLLTLKAPVLVPGDHTLTVRGSDGAIASGTVNVAKPGYAILALKTVSKNQPGTKARFWLGVKALNGFTGSATLGVTVPDSTWTGDASPHVVSDETMAIVSLDIPATAAPGDYHSTVTTSEGGQLDLLVSVVTAAPDPFLSSLTSYAELVGGTFTLHGYGFGSTPGVLTVDNQNWTATAWADDEITVTVPTGSKSGLLRVKTASGRISNGITFGVRDYGFQFHTNQLDFHVQGGDAKTIDVQLAGYVQPVNLTTQSLSPQIQVGLEPAFVTPTGLTHLTFVVDKNIPVGTYPVSISGNSGLYEGHLTLNVIVGSALEFVNTGLPSALMGTNYGARLTARNVDGTAVFSISSGVLPRGLTLSAAGAISGRATEAGLFRVVLAVGDSSGHLTTKEFALTVDETGWGRLGHDESQSWYSPVESPADSRSLWSSAAVGAPVRFLAGGGNFFVQTSSGLAALYGAKGTTLYRISGNLSGLAYVQGRLMALDDQGVFHVWESGFGNEVWNREGVTRYWPKSGTILAESNGQVLVIDGTLGILTSTVNADLAGTLVGWKGDLYRLQGRNLQLWADSTGWSTVYQDPEAALSSASGDGGSLYLQNSRGTVHLWDGTAAKTLWTGGVSHLVTLGDLLAVDTGSSIEIRDRADGHLLRSWTGGGYGQLFAAREKLFGLRQGTLSALNVTTGSVIWQASAVDALLSGDRLYGVSSTGVVTAYNAPDNLKAPTTTLVTLPAQPGLQGWYTTQPTATLSAVDPETYATATVWKLDGSDWQTSSPVTLTEGVHSLAWHSTDTGNLTESDKLATVKVDSVPPVTSLTMSLASLPGLTNVWGAPVSLTLKAQDATSGVAAMEYQINGGAWLTYTQPVSLSAEGVYTFDYRSRDQAGNVEISRRQPVILDFQNPTASAQSQAGTQAQFVFLTGSDAGSGLNHLEYMINGGAVTVYSDVVAFTTAGNWTLAYRAVDNAGRTSAWQNLTVKNQGPENDQNLGKITYDKGLFLRDQVIDVKTGALLFLNSLEKVLTVPSFLTGAAYLRGRDTDSQSSAAAWISINVTGPTVITYLKEPLSQAVMTGWTAGPLVPAGTFNKKYFTQGHQSYTKTLAAGDTVVLNGPKLKTTGGDLIFIQSLWSGVQIIAPAPNTDLEAGQSITLKAFASGLSSNLTWTVQEPGKAPQTLGPGASVAYTLSPQADGGVLNVRVRGTLGGKTVDDTASWNIVRQEKLKILTPAPDRPQKIGVPFTPQVTYRDNQGRKTNPPAIVWTVTQNGKVVYQGGAPITLSTKGAATLTGTLTSPTNRTVTASTNFTVVDLWPWGSWHWHDKGLNAWDDDVGEGFWGDPRARDDRRDAQTRNGRLGLPVWNWTRDAQWRTTVDNGTYEVKLVVGPFRPWDVHTVTVNTQPLNVQVNKNDGQVLALQFVVKVTDGLLKVQGTDGLAFYRLDWRRTDDTTPGASIIGPLDTPEDLQ